MRGVGGQRSRAVVLTPREGGNPRQGHDFLRLVPVLEGEKHIRSHQEPELIPGVLVMEFRQSVAGVAPTRPAQLQVQGRHAVAPAQALPQAVRHERRHGQPVGTLSPVGGQLLMGRLGSGDEDEPVQFQQFHRRLGRGHMPQVGRIEGAAIDADFHDRRPPC